MKEELSAMLVKGADEASQDLIFLFHSQAAKEKVEEDNKSLRDSVATLHVAINVSLLHISLTSTDVKKETKKEHEGVRVKLQNNIETLEKEV
eukprot:156687-Hanusia_phi.AAC.3